MTGVVYLVGAGPGAADLLTLRAARLLARADIVFHDALVPPAILALASRAEQVEVGKRSGRHSTAQAFINKRLVDAARKHKVVVRLKGGDPLLFGRAQEELACLKKSRIRVEIVPGVTAALAADTVVIYMGAGEAESIAGVLTGAGKSPATPVALVEYASLPSARKLSGTLAQLPALAQRCGNGPVAILMGEAYRDAVASNIIASWPNEKSSEHSSSSPTARAIRSGRGRSSSS